MITQRRRRPLDSAIQNSTPRMVPQNLGGEAFARHRRRCGVEWMHRHRMHAPTSDVTPGAGETRQEFPRGSIVSTPGLPNFGASPACTCHRHLTPTGSMMFIDEEQEALAQGRSKTLALAAHCAWLQLVLEHQDRILASVDVMATCRSTLAWTRQWTLLQEAVRRHFQLEELVGKGDIPATRLRAHAVIAGASRGRILVGLQTLENAVVA